MLLGRTRITQTRRASEGMRRGLEPASLARQVGPLYTHPTLTRRASERERAARPRHTPRPRATRLGVGCGRRSQPARLRQRRGIRPSASTPRWRTFGSVCQLPPRILENFGNESLDTRPESCINVCYEDTAHEGAGT